MNEQRIRELKNEIKKLSKKSHRRFNVLLKIEAFKKIEAEAEKQGISKAKTLNKIILNN